MAADTVTETTTTKAEVKQFTLDEISKHQSHDDCWLIIGNESNGMYEYICINVLAYGYDCQKKEQARLMFGQTQGSSMLFSTDRFVFIHS